MVFLHRPQYFMTPLISSSPCGRPQLFQFLVRQKSFLQHSKTRFQGEKGQLIGTKGEWFHQKSVKTEHSVTNACPCPLRHLFPLTPPLSASADIAFAVFHSRCPLTPHPTWPLLTSTAGDFAPPASPQPLCSFLASGYFSFLEMKFWNSWSVVMNQIVFFTLFCFYIVTCDLIELICQGFLLLSLFFWW